MSWPAPPGAIPRLAGDEVHIHTARLWPSGDLREGLTRALAPDEWMRAAGFRHRLHRDRFVFSRALLRHLLATYAAVPAEGIAFAYGPAGKPRLADPGAASRLAFSVSHTVDLTLLAFSVGGSLGVDVEALDAVRDWAGLADRVLSPGEHAKIVALPSSDRAAAFLKVWTCKEALLKATGEGLVDDLPAIEVCPDPSRPARLLAFRGDLNTSSSWSLAALSPAPGFGAAVAWRQA